MEIIIKWSGLYKLMRRRTKKLVRDLLNGLVILAGIISVLILLYGIVHLSK